MRTLSTSWRATWRNCSTVSAPYRQDSLLPSCVIPLQTRHMNNVALDGIRASVCGNQLIDYDSLAEEVHPSFPLPVGLD